MELAHVPRKCVDRSQPCDAALCGWPGARLVLRHHNLPDDGECRHHAAGWQLYLDRLAVRLAGGDPGPDPNA